MAADAGQVAVPRVVLASASPRRRELLAQLGVDFAVQAPDIDESVRPGEDPVAYVRRLAAEKCAVVAAAHPVDALVVAADTTVDLGGEILGKPVDADDAADMLRRLSGRTHRVHTGVALRRGNEVRVEASTTLVTLTPITAEMLAWYLATGEPMDKAGAYAIQGAGAVFVQRVMGSVSNVVGLPLTTVLRLAAELGVPLVASTPE